MPEYAYAHLSNDQRYDALVARLVDLEREHYRTSLVRDEAAASPARAHEVAGLDEARARVESSLNTLRGRLTREFPGGRPTPPVPFPS